MAHKILLIDDEPDMLSTCARLVRRLGHDCLTAQDAPQAMQMIKEQHPDLVVTDLHLPTGDGFEVSRYIRQSQPQTPVILMTAYHTPDTVRRATLNGATAYLSKPFSNADLSDAIQRALAPSRQKFS
jgi:CheY-like chemotaxis protein